MFLFLNLFFLSKSNEAADFYSFDVLDIEGNTVSLEKYRGTVRMF